jgi:hypothetical protein
VPQALAAYQLLKDASAPQRSYGQRLELAEGTSPRWFLCHCTDKAGNICSVPLHICRDDLLLGTTSSAAGNDLGNITK